MDYVLIFFAILLLLVGIAGCFLPVLPGPPIAFLGLVLIQLTSSRPFTTEFLIWMGTGTAVVTLIDYLVPPLATRKFGGSRFGVLGSILGVLAGLVLFPPWGILIFPFVGAYLGEMINGAQASQARRAAVGTVIGQMTGTLLKVVFTIVIGYYIFSGAPWV